MTERITEKNINRLLCTINTEAKRRGVPGFFTVAGAYGGWRMERQVAESNYGDPLNTGFVPRRKLYDAMWAFLAGLRAVPVEE